MAANVPNMSPDGTVNSLRNASTKGTLLCVSRALRDDVLASRKLSRQTAATTVRQSPVSGPVFPQNGEAKVLPRALGADRQPVRQSPPGDEVAPYSCGTRKLHCPTLPAAGRWRH